jgi:hypothetical protein
MKHLSLPAIALIVLCIVSALALALAVRGLPGNPDESVLDTPTWKDNGPLELSPERGRFALLYSVVENGSLQFTTQLARFTTPDVAIRPDGKYVSLFAPAVSFIAIPGYVIGKLLGASQVGAFAVSAFFAFLNILLVRALAIRLGAGKYAASFGALAFAFGTPAFAYAATLYQHHITTFLILLGLYALAAWPGVGGLALIWFLCAAGVVIDNPNLFLLFPVGIAALGRIMFVDRDPRRKPAVVLRPLRLLTFAAAVVPMLLFLWFNAASTGNAFQLPGTLRSVPAIDESGNPQLARGSNYQGDVAELFKEAPENKTALGFFQTRNLLNGFYVHFLSPDRGMVYYAPIVLFGIFGLALAYARDRRLIGVILATIGVNILLYSLWGDPWGGWAFGSRYLIPSYALLGIGVGLALTAWRKQWFVLPVAALLMGYSVWVNALGAVTSGTNPPQVQVLELEALSGREEKYTWARNLQMLDADRSKAFVFEAWAHAHMTAMAYQRTLVGIILAAAFAFLGLNRWMKEPTNTP